MMQSWLLKNARVVTSDGCSAADIRIRHGKIREMDGALVSTPGETVLDCFGSFVYPGLINSHDHLAFNLYTRLGDPPYENAYQWGADLHSRWKKSIESIERIPVRDRLRWGAWKNLFSGATHVVHHDPHSLLFRFGFPVDVLRPYTFAHSLGYEPNLRRALRGRRINVPFMIHLAEGTDERSAREVSDLERLGGLDDRTVAVHAVGLTRECIELLGRRKASVVWCPSSNLFLFGKTAPIEGLSKYVNIALGTDSTLTGSLTLFDELRIARRHSSFTARELFLSVTVRPRGIFRLTDGVGVLCEGGKADLFLLPHVLDDPFEELLNAKPGDISLLLKNGKVVMHDPALFTFDAMDGSSSEVALNGKVKHVGIPGFAELRMRLKPFIGHYRYMNDI